MTGLVITQAALHAALIELRLEGLEYEDDAQSIAFLASGLKVLAQMIDPAHAAPVEKGAAAPAEHETPSAMTMAARCQVSEAGTPAPPTIELPAGPGPERLTPADSQPQEGACSPIAPAPSADQAAEGHHPSDTTPGKWTRERIALLTEHLPTCVDRPALLARINERPGLPIATVKAMMVKARALGIQVEPWVPRAIETAAGERGGRTSVQVGQPTKMSEVRTAERFAAFPALWMDPALSVPEIHARMNAMPGAEVKTSTQLYGWAKKAGLPTQRPLPRAAIEDEDDAAEDAAPEASEPPPAPPEPAPEPAAPAPRTLNPRNSKAGPALTGEVSAKADAFDAFTASQTVRQVADEFGIGLNTISTWHAEWMRAPKKDAAA
jgi:nicotinate-nucleotide--dimethylbenzimidazole phosphoribosyltransferase